MAKTKTVTPCKQLTLHALCPHCDSDLTELNQTDDATGAFIGDYNKGEGGWVTACESCGETFTVPQDMINDIQHQCLVLLGEG